MFPENSPTRIPTAFRTAPTIESNDNPGREHLDDTLGDRLDVEGWPKGGI
jgi:hypothetical protein